MESLKAMATSFGDFCTITLAGHQCNGGGWYVPNITTLSPQKWFTAFSSQLCLNISAEKGKG